MDLDNLGSTYLPEEGAVMELMGPDGAQLFNDDKTPMTITLLGADSDIAIKARNTATNRRLAQGVRAKLTAEALESEGAAYLATLTTGWNITMGGTKPEFTRDAALALYNNPRLTFIREQVDAFVGDRSHFMKG
jgi:hypothetical protein